MGQCCTKDDGISNLGFDGDAAQKRAEKQAVTKTRSSAASNPRSGNGREKESRRKIDVPERSNVLERSSDVKNDVKNKKETEGDAARGGDGEAPRPAEGDDALPPTDLDVEKNEGETNGDVACDGDGEAPRPVEGGDAALPHPDAEDKKEIARAAIREFVAKIKEERKTSAEDWRQLVRAMQEKDAADRLISHMESAGEEDRHSVDWRDADPVEPRPGFTKKMSDIAEDREKSWEGGGGIPSINLADVGEGAGPRPALNSESSMFLLMDQMERLGDELLAEVDGWGDDDDDGADPGEAGGKREGPHPARRGTDALLLRMEALNLELAAEIDSDDDEEEEASPYDASVRDTTDLLNGMEDLGDVLSPRKTALRRLSEE